jgi:prophage regulatory protein
MDQVIRMKDVVKKIGLCGATIYAMISRGEFPRPSALENLQPDGASPN